MVDDALLNAWFCREVLPLERSLVHFVSRNWRVADDVMDLTLEEEGRLGSLFFMAQEENLVLQMRQPWIKFGTDAGGADPASAQGLTHPRAYGTFTRILGRYVRDERVIPLEDAFRGRPAPLHYAPRNWMRRAA